MDALYIFQPLSCQELLCINPKRISEKHSCRQGLLIEIICLYCFAKAIRSVVVYLY